MKHAYENTQKYYDNGYYLICQNNELVLKSRYFQDKLFHLTTWQQTRINKETGKTQHIQKVLDFVMVENQI